MQLELLKSLLNNFIGKYLWIGTFVAFPMYYVVSPQFRQSTVQLTKSNAILVYFNSITYCF